jgi:hypothetical protein
MQDERRKRHEFDIRHWYLVSEEWTTGSLPLLEPLPLLSDEF